jgi:hypothetical protein
LIFGTSEAADDLVIRAVKEFGRLDVMVSPSDLPGSPM